MAAHKNMYLHRVGQANRRKIDTGHVGNMYKALGLTVEQALEAEKHRLLDLEDRHSSDADERIIRDAKRNLRDFGFEIE